jgi:hypothetical protein
MRITLYTKAECGLCDELKADLALLAQDRALRHVQLAIQELDIDNDESLQAKFRYLVPVLTLPDGSLHYPPHDYAALRAALIGAAAIQPERRATSQADPTSKP